MIDVDRVELIFQLNEDNLVFKTQGSPSVTMERKHEKLLSLQSQQKPPQSNSKFGVGRPQPCSAYLWSSVRAHCQAIDIKEALIGRQPNFIYLY